MYKVNPGEARTDLYGIGQGAAQVLDLTPLREQSALNQKKQFAREEAKRAEADAREGEALKQLATMSKIAVLPREQKMFAEEQAALYEDFKKNKIAKIRAGGPEASEALIDFQQRIGDLTTKAELSKNTRELIEKQYAQMMTKGNDSYSKKSKAYLSDYVTNEKYNGDYSFDPTQIYETFDYDDHFRKNLYPHAKSVAGANEKGYTSSYTLDQAERDLEDDLLSDPVRMRQANEDFEEAKDKLGAVDGIDYIKKKYGPKMVINSTKPAPQWIVNPDESKNINVTNTINDDGGQIHVMNKNNNEEVTIEYGPDGEVIGGIQNTRLTPEQKTQNDAVFKSNLAKKKLYHERVQYAKKEAAKYSAADGIAIAESLMPDPNSVEFAEEPLPYQEQNIKLDKATAQALAHDKYGIKPKEIIAGKAPKHVDVQRVDNKKKQAPAAKTDWSKYKRK